MTAPLDLHLLGTARLSAGADEIALPTRKSLVLLARLAIAPGKAMLRAELAAFLWADHEAERARASLRQALARLRQVLGEARGAVAASPDLVRLAPGRWRVDLERIDSEPAAGEFLAGLYLKEPLIDGWIEDQRRIWRGEAMASLTRRIEAKAGQGDARSTVRLGLAAMALDPLAEGVHRHLMRAWADLGEGGKALAQYAALQNLLGLELNVAPEPQTQALAREIRDRRLRPPVPPTAAPPPAAPAAAAAQPAEEDAAPGSLRLLSAVALAWDEPPGLGLLQAAVQMAAAAGAEALAQSEDALSVAFGLHRADEEEARHALRFAAEAGQRLSPPPGIGAASGLAVVGGAAPQGSLFARAQALSQLSAPGEAFVDAAIAQQAGAAAATEAVAMGQRTALRLRGVGAAPVRPQAPFVGRDLELAQLGALLAAAGSGRGGVALLRGDPGIGKTRLADELAARARAAGAQTAAIGFQPFGSDSRPLREALARAVAGDAGTPAVAPADLPAELRGMAQHLLGDTGGEIARLYDPEAGRDLALRAILALMRARAAAAPLVVRIEDCHWADELQLSLLTGLARSVHDMGVLLLLTERALEAGLGGRLQGDVDARAFVLTLTPLGDGEARVLLDRAGLGDRSRQSAIVGHASGNPLFLLQLARARRAGSEALPPSVIALAQQQLDQAPADIAAACRRAAILGLRFTEADFAAIFPDIQAIDLIRSGFVRFRGEQMEFVHALIQEAVYATIPEALRRGLHLRAAHWYRGRDPVPWAEHSIKTGERELAARACLAAVEKLLPQSRFRAAERFVAAGLEAAEAPDIAACLRYCQGVMLREQGRLEAALEAFDGAFAAAQDANLRARLALRRSAVHKLRDRDGDYLAALAEADAIAAAAELTPATLAELEHERGNAAFRRADAESCLSHHRAGLAHAEASGDVLQRARALGGIGDAQYARFRLRSARQAFGDCVGLAVAHRLNVVAHAHRHMLAFCGFIIEPGAAALDAIAATAEQARLDRSVRNEIYARMALVEFAAYGRDLPRFERELAAMRALVGAGPSQFDRDLAYLDVLGHLLRGRRAEALDGARAAWRQWQGGYIGPTFAGLVAAFTHDPAERAAMLSAGKARLIAGALPHTRIAFSLLAMEAARRAGEPGSALTLAAELDAAAAEPVGLVTLPVRMTRAWAANDAAAMEAAESALRGAGLSFFCPSRLSND